MKKVLLTILMSMGVLTAHSQVMVATHYDSEHTAKHIMRGHVKMYLQDSIKFVVEKKSERYIIYYDQTSDDVKAKLDKVFKKGKLEYTSRTNGGYIFTISVVDPNDDVNIINYCTFHVNAWTQKIEEIEILKGEL
jgi:hypothetical protein